MFEKYSASTGKYKFRPTEWGVLHDIITHTVAYNTDADVLIFVVTFRSLML